MASSAAARRLLCLIAHFIAHCRPTSSVGSLEAKLRSMGAIRFTAPGCAQRSIKCATKFNPNNVQTRGGVWSERRIWIQPHTVRRSHQTALPEGCASHNELLNPH